MPRFGSDHNQVMNELEAQTVLLREIRDLLLKLTHPIAVSNANGPVIVPTPLVVGYPQQPHPDSSAYPLFPKPIVQS